MSTPLSPIKKAALGALVVGATLTGGAVGAALITPAGAQDATSTTVATTTDSSSADVSTAPKAVAPDRDPSKGGHEANGVTEELLTGDDLAKATAAANAAVPNGTIERVETDAEGDAYEAHMVDADGNHVTVKLDTSFNLVKVEQGPGSAPAA